MSEDGKAVIWDLDGVIVDSAEFHWEAWHQLARETGASFTRADFLATFGQRNSEIIPRFWPIQNSEQIAELADRKEQLFRSLLRTNGITPLPGALPLMRALEDSGWRQALGSSAPRANIDVIVDLLGLRPLLEAEISGEEVPNGKPAPATFLLAARRLGVPPSRSIVVEDAVAGVEAAHACGMKCVAVTNGRDNPALRIADRVVASLLDIHSADFAALLPA